MSEDKLPWYEKWFKESYLELYPHRNEAEAETQIKFVLSIAKEITPLKIRDTLDIACGAGRHVEQLLRHGLNARGIDLSETLVQLANERLLKANLTGEIIQSDMRSLPFADDSFDLVTSMFTSFGYFSEDKTNELALQEWRRVLKNNGVLFIDFLNREQLIGSFCPETTKMVGNKTVKELRSVSKDGLRIEKEITISDEDNIESFIESVRMFSKDELNEMVTNNGFSVITFFGDFTGSAFSSDSERLLIFAKAK